MDGKEALEVLDHRHIDLIIADIQMQEVNGYELVREIWEGGSMIQIILITAMNTYAHKKKDYTSGIDDYMTMPIEYAELVGVLRLFCAVPKSTVRMEGDTETEYDTIKTYISRLRNKLGRCREFDIAAIRGIGYKAVLNKPGDCI